MMKKLFPALCLLLLILGCSSFVTAYDVQDINIHGYVSQGYLKTDDNNYLVNSEDGSFEFTEIGINFSKTFDKLRVGLQLLSRDIGEFGNNDIKLDWAMGDYSFKDYLSFQVGKIKTPMGFYNQERDVDMLRLPVMLPAAVYDEGNRENVGAFQGINVYGALSFSHAGEFDYEIYYGNIDSAKDSIWTRGTQEQMTAALPPGSSSNINSISTEYTAGAALRWSPLDGLRLGVTYSRADVDIDTTLSNPMFPTGSATLLLDIASKRIVASAEYMWNDLILVAEYNTRELDSGGMIVGVGPRPQQITESMGWYFQASYQFTEKLSAGVYYSEYYPNKDDKDGVIQVALGFPDFTAWQKEVVPSLRYDVMDNLVIKGEVHFMDGAAFVYGYNNPEGKDEDWLLYSFKATFSF